MGGRGRSTSRPLLLAWLPLALLLGERTVAPPVQGRPLAESEFRGAEEAWTTTGAATPAVYTPQGFQSARLGAKGQGKVWFFVAPPPFLGDKLGAYHGVLEFRLGHATHTGAELPRDKLWGVLLEGKGITIATATRVGLNSLLLTEDGGWTVTRGVGGGHAPTQGQLLALFSDITALKIRGHFYKTSEMTWISSVRLLAGDEDLGKLRARIPKTLTAQPLAEVNKVGVGMVLSQRVSGFSSQLQPSGLKWLVAGVRQPVAGSVLTSTTLAAALMRKMGKQDWDTYREHGTSNIEFTQQEWKAFGIADLRSDHFIQSGAFYFQPVQRQTYEFYIKALQSGSPAHLCHAVQIGDVLLQVDGKDAGGKTLSDIGKLIVGEIGTKLDLVMKKESTKQTYMLTLERRPLSADTPLHVNGYSPGVEGMASVGLVLQPQCSSQAACEQYSKNITRALETIPSAAYFVDFLQLGSPAHLCGAVSVGDKLIRVDGQTLAGKRPSDVARLLIGKLGTKARLMLQKERPSGLKWLVAGVRQPVAGSVLTSTTLAAALMRKMGKQDWDTYREHGTSNIEFTQQEWKAFGIADLRSDHFIQSGAFYFQPVQRQTYEQTFERRPASKPESLTDLFVRPRQQDLESTKPRTQSPSIADVRDLDIEMQHSHHVPSQKTITDSESLRESPNPRQGLDKKEEVPSQVSAADAHREANHFMKQSQPAVENAVAADEHQISDAVIRRDGIGFARRWRLARSGIGKRDESNFSQSNRNVKSEL